jgi:hypothetical protein
MNTDGVAGYAMGCLGVVIVHAVLFGLFYGLSFLIGNSAISLTFAGVFVALIDIGVIIFLYAKGETDLGTAYLVGTALIAVPLLILGACIGFLN